MNVACGCANPKPKALVCGTLYESYRSKCPQCGEKNPRCNQLFQKLGSAIATSGAAVDVTESQDPKYFQLPGTVLAYVPVALSPPDAV